MEEDQPAERATFSARLDALFRQVRPAGRGEYTYEEVAKGVSKLGYDISAAYVWQLRKGDRTNPTLRHINGLARFFGVPASYFIDDEMAEKVGRELELLVAMRDAGVQNIALRAHGLSPDAQQAMLAMIEAARKAERLDGGS